MAIVLAAVDQIRVIINDSRGACKNIERGYIPYYAYKILQDSSYTGAPTLVWTPAHVGLKVNEEANAMACRLTYQTMASAHYDADSDSNPIFTFKWITKYYQNKAYNFS